MAIPPQINKYYISDLAPGRSLVEHVVGAGVPYFAVSWRNPTAAQRDWNLDTYVAACKEAIEVACEITGSPDANVVGMCAGAITMACLLGHLAATGEHLVNSATFLVAGLDTAQESQIGMLGVAARGGSGPRCARNGPATSTATTWPRCSRGSVPNELVWNYWVNNYLMGQNPPAFDILYWNADTTRLPAGLHSDFLDLFVSNGLVEDTLTVLDTPVELGKVDVDAYVVAGSTDHIVPWQTAYRTTQLLGGESRVRPELERSHPSHREPARQPQGVVLHRRRRAAARGGRVARAPNSTPAPGGTTGRPGSTPAPATSRRTDRRWAATPTRRSSPAPGRYVHLT